MATLLVGAVATAAGLFGLKRYCSGGVCKNMSEDLNGKTVLITGANTGIGKIVATQLARMGARVIIACRDENKMQRAVEEIKKKTASVLVEGMLLDLADTESIQQFSRALHSRVDALHVLINNAGVMMTPHWLTKQGHEIQLGTNHLGHFLLTSLLLDLLKKGAPARIICVSSNAHGFPRQIVWDDLMWKKRSYNRVMAYGMSKLANVMFARELNKRLEGTGVTANSLHPGVVRTELYRYLPSALHFLITALYPAVWLCTKDEWQGSQTSIYAAVAPELNGVGGKYLVDCAVHVENALARDDANCKKLWEASESLLGISFKV